MDKEQINPKIKCEKCKSSYPNITLGGKEKRENCIIQRYYCKKCKIVFALNLPEIKIIKPKFCEIEIGFEIKIKAQIKDNSGLGIKSVKCLIMGMSYTKEITLKFKDGYFEGICSTHKLVEGKYKIIITAEDFSGGIRKNTKTVRVVQHYDEIIREIAPKYGFEPALIKAIIFRESSFDHRAVSNKDAKGLMQIRPVNIKDLGITNPFDPEENINGGCKYLKKMLGQFENLDLALAAYNAGPDKLQYWLKKGRNIPRDVHKFINDVKTSHEEYKNDEAKYK